MFRAAAFVPYTAMRENMIRNRIKELRRVKAGTLRPNPKNWRTHPAAREVLRGLLAEIGYADALLARELTDGGLELIDGHLRAEISPDEDVPVLVLDLSPAEADKLLALHDPLAAMAETDFQALTNLVAQVETENAAIQRTLDRLAASSGAAAAPFDESEQIEIAALYQVVVQCDDEAGQRQPVRATERRRLFLSAAELVKSLKHPRPGAKDEIARHPSDLSDSRFLPRAAGGRHVRRAIGRKGNRGYPCRIAGLYRPLANWPDRRAPRGAAKPCWRSGCSPRRWPIGPFGRRTEPSSIVSARCPFSGSRAC